MEAASSALVAYSAVVGLDIAAVVVGNYSHDSEAGYEPVPNSAASLWAGSRSAAAV